MTSIIDEIAYLRGQARTELEILQAYNNTICIKEDGPVKSVYCFGVPVCREEQPVQLLFTHATHRSFFKGTSSFIRVDDNIEMSSEIGEIVVSAHWKAQMKKENAVYMIVEDPSVKSRAIVSPTFNGVSIMAPISNERTFKFRIQYYAQNLKVKNNGKYTAFLQKNNIPLFTVSCIGALNSGGKIISHCEIKHKKINDNVYELSVFTSENNANYLLFEINVYEPKLFLDTTVESKNIKLTNTFGGVAFMDNTDSFGEMWLYSKLNVSQLKILNDKKIINARLHIPNLNKSKQPLIFNDITAFFCSFDSNWENKIPIKESGRSDNTHNRYYTFDFTNHICDEKKRFRITNGFAIKANNENNGVSVISTSDCYYAPQILEIKYI